MHVRLTVTSGVIWCRLCFCVLFWGFLHTLCVRWRTEGLLRCSFIYGGVCRMDHSRTDQRLSSARDGLWHQIQPWASVFVQRWYRTVRGHGTDGGRQCTGDFAGNRWRIRRWKTSLMDGINGGGPLRLSLHQSRKFTSILVSNECQNRFLPRVWWMMDHWNCMVEGECSWIRLPRDHWPHCNILCNK